MNDNQDSEKNRKKREILQFGAINTMMNKLVKSLKQISKKDVLEAGGKGASLGEMTQMGIPVPPGYVVLAEAFERFIEETSLAAEIDSILHKVNHEDINTMEKASEKIKALILRAEMPKDIATEIEKHFKQLGAEFVAVRSSATVEDSSAAAWAGQLDSFLNTPESAILDKVKRCWASLFTPRAIFYRFEKGLRETKISVAVVVQKMVDSEVSGIAFSVHPVTQDYNQLIIEAGFGLGEAIVSGTITPDNYVMEKQPRRILEKNRVDQKKGLFRASNGGNEWKEIQEGDAQKLSDEEILILTEMIIKIENHYGFPCDIEWAREKGQFYITQSRPITTLMGTKKIKREIKYELTFKEFFPIFWDYQWVNERYQKSVYRLIGKNPPSVSVYKNGDMTKFWPENLARSLSEHLLPNLTESWAKEELLKFKSLIKEFRDKVDSLGNTQSKLVLDDLKRQLYKILLTIEEINGFSNGFYFVGVACEEKLRCELTKRKWDKESINNALLKISSSQLEPTVLSRYNNEISRISRDIFENVCSENKEWESYTDDRLWLEIKNNVPKIEEVLDDIHAKYYWLLSFSVDKVRNKESFIPDIISALRLKSFDVKKPDELQIPLDLVPYSEVLRVSGYIKDEASSFTIPYLWYKLRSSWQKIMDHYGIEIGEFQQLTGDELLVGSPNPLKLKELARKRMECAIMKYDSNTGVTIIVNKEAYNMSESLFNDQKNKEPVLLKEGEVIHGIPANLGLVSGPVRVVHKSSEISAFPKGSILVTAYTAPEFVPAMKNAIAIVTDTGGITSHAAIVSRELGKACVIGTKIATATLKDGDIIEVDANKGIIRILKRA